VQHHSLAAREMERAMNTIRPANASGGWTPDRRGRAPAEHCRHALGLLEELQELLLHDPRGLPLTDALRLLAAAKDCVWRSVWLLEGVKP